MTDPTRRRFSPTPAWLISGLLVVEGLLWLTVAQPIAERTASPAGRKEEPPLDLVGL